jgi:hypothetical protein
MLTGNQLPVPAVFAPYPAHANLSSPYLRFLWGILAPNLQPTHTTPNIPHPFFFHFLLHISYAPISFKPSSRKLNIFVSFFFLEQGSN